jgi:predicted dehydrogenase
MGFLHAGLLNILPCVQLSALCEKSRLITRFCKKLFNGVHVVNDIAELSDLNLDIVYVTTPISTHHLITKYVYENEIARNLFVEKTLASNAIEAEDLCNLSLKFPGKTMVGYVRRFSVVFRKAKEILSQEPLGKLTSFSGYAYSSDFVDYTNSKQLIARRGVLRDLGCHLFDLALWFFGDLQVNSVRNSLIEGAKHIRVSNTDCIDGQFSVSCCMENYRLPEVGLLVNGLKGILRVNDDKVELNLKDGKSFTWYRHDLNDNVTFHLGAPEFFTEDAQFISSVLNDYVVEPSFHTASKIDDFIERIEHKAEKDAR